MTEDAIGGLRPQYQTYARQKCFIAYSEQAHWSVDLLSACEEVLSQPEYNLEVDYARKHFAADIPLRQKALELIANARYGIYDISYWRPDERSSWQMPRNVMIELGIAITLNRPILLLRHASNRELPLPKGLQCLSDQILEFSGTTTLKKSLTVHLSRWINTPPKTAWWNRYCTFGRQVCSYRETHPQAKQLGKKELACMIADGEDPCRPDFRNVVEEVLNRNIDLTYTYLDSLSLKEGYSFLLCNHCQITRSSPFAIYRITSHTSAEAFVSVGISLALETQFGYKIPKILITEDVQDVPSLLTGYEVCPARNDRERKTYLKKFIPEVLIKTRQTSWKPRPLPFIEISLTVATSDNNELQSSSKDKSIERESIDFSRRRSFKASLQGILIAKQQKSIKGWTQERLAEATAVSLSTIRRFFSGKPIDRQTFIAICQTLEIDWFKVASLEEQEFQNTSLQDQTTTSRKTIALRSVRGAELVREALLRRAWTQERLAEATAVSLSTIRRFFSGKPIDRQTFKMICEFLGLNPEELADIEHHESPELVHEFSVLRTKLIDREVLINTLTDLNITVKTNTDIRGFDGQRVRVDIAAILEGEYDLGWSRNIDGFFDLIGCFPGVAKRYNQRELIHSINQKYAELINKVE